MKVADRQNAKSSVTIRPFGSQLREWRLRRGMSQLFLANEAEISTRHLSFIETGRSTPSREMVLRLAERLDISIREQNSLLVAAGHAPTFSERSLDDPELGAARAAIEIVMDGHKPYPAFLLDRHWQMLSWNSGLPQLFEGVSPHLLRPPVNVLRLCLHPDGLAPRIANLQECARNISLRLARRIDLTADPILMELENELGDYLRAASIQPIREAEAQIDEIMITLRIMVAGQLVSLFSTTMVFGTAMDITLSELALECFFPADAQTAQIVRTLQSDPLLSPITSEVMDSA